MKGRIIKIVMPIDNKHYPTVSLSKKGIVSVIFVHVFFATAFIPNPKKKKHVNHKNGDKRIYELWNLEWATKGEDLQHAYDTGLKKKGKHHHWFGQTVRPKGANNGRARLVLDMQTGIFYETCVEAAYTKGYTAFNLGRYLRGDRANYTSLLYV